MRGVRLLLKMAAVLSLLSIVLLFFLTQGEIRYYRNALAARTVELSNLKPLLEEWERMAGTRETTARKLEVYRELVMQEPVMYGILKELSRLTPKEIQLTEISYEKGGPLRLKGLAYSSQGAEIILAEYMAKMASSPLFREVDLYYTKEVNDYTVRASQFDLGVTLK